MITPHGGHLVDRILTGEARQEAYGQAETLPHIPVPVETLRDVENIARGVFSPLTGFLGRDDFSSVLDRMRLADGTPWTIPIVLDMDDATARSIRDGQDAVLVDGHGRPTAVLHVHERYRYDKREYAQQVFGTTDPAHPGVARVFGLGDTLVAGTIDVVRELDNPCQAYTKTPLETRRYFAEKGWRTVVAFQTRNVPHAGHEDLQKTVLGLVDGLMIQPIIGRKKKGDFKDDLILKAYQVLIEHYFNQDRVLLNILPTEMRYGGPKEAIFHAIMRKNYGCTHIVIGRDHAGVGKFYHEEAAIEIFDQFDDLGIIPITIHGDFFYCTRCKEIASNRTCPHGSSQHISFSGSEIRQMILQKIPPPPEIMRPEVFDVLKAAAQPFVE